MRLATRGATGSLSLSPSSRPPFLWPFGELTAALRGSFLSCNASKEQSRAPPRLSAVASSALSLSFASCPQL